MAGADPRRWTGGPTDGRVGRPAEGAARPAAAPGGWRWPVTGSPPAGGARGAPASVERRRRGGPRGGRRARRRGRGAHAGGRPRGTPAGAPRSRSAAGAVGHAGELHPRVCAAFGVPAADRGRGGGPRRPARRTRWPSSPAPELSTYPVAKEDVALVVADDVPAEDAGRAPCARAPGELCESVRLFDVYTGEQIGDGPQVAGLRAALPRARPHPDRGRDRRGPRRRGGAGRRAARRRAARLSLPSSACCAPPADRG